MPGPDLYETLAVMAGAAAVVGVAGWWATRPRVPGTIRWIPPTAIQFLGVIVFVLMVPHMLGLLGGADLLQAISSQRGYRG